MTTFTIVHVVISLVGIATGLVVAAGLLNAKRLDGWTILFLASTIATSLTGSAFRSSVSCRRTSSGRSRSWSWPRRSTRDTFA